MKIRVGVVGIGSMGRGIVSIIQKNPEMEVVAISDIDENALKRVNTIISNNIVISRKAEDVLDTKPDVLIDATPSIIESAFLVKEALSKKINVILMNTEVDQVFGRYLANEAEKNGVILTSDAGDQHGVLARTIFEIKLMGLEIVMAGNNKGFLDRYATPDTIIHEAAIRRLSLKQCTQYTDGTKLAIEMALIANSQNLSILKTGMTGPEIPDVNDVYKVFNFDQARKLGGVVDYILGAEPGGSVFIIGYTDIPDEQFYWNYYKMGKGPYYLFIRPYHLCHFETPLAILKVMKYKEPILIQKKRILEVGTRAKTDLKAGTVLDGVGGFKVYGMLEKPENSLPIGLSEGTKLLKNKKQNEPISWTDVEFPNNDLRIELWEKQVSLEKKTYTNLK